MKLYQRSAIISLLLAFSITGVRSQTQTNLKEAGLAISKSNETYFEAFEKGTYTLLKNHYTADCWIMMAGSPTFCGEDAPYDFFKSAYESGVRNGKFISIDIAGNGEEFVTETGFYHFYNGRKELMERGKYLVLWKKTSEGWKMFRNSFNADDREK